MSWWRDNSEWRLNKKVQFVNSALEAEFRTRYDDYRDIMCDCPRPEWGISQREDNRLVEIRDRGELVYKAVVSRDVGNRMYRDIVQLSKMWNPFRQRAFVDEWAENGEWVDESRRQEVLAGANH